MTRPARAKRLAGGAIFLGLALMGIGLWFLCSPAQYRATVRMEIEVHENPDEYNPYFIQTTFELLGSGLVLSNVVQTLNLNARLGERYAGGRAWTTDQSVKWVQRRMEIRPVRNTKFIDISVTDRDPETAARIANAIPQGYHDFEAGRIRRTIEFLQAQYQAEENDIQIKREELAQWQKPVNPANPGSAESTPEPRGPAYFSALQELTNAEFIHGQHKIVVESLTATNMGSQNVGTDMEITVVDPAGPPKVPASPNRLLGLILLFCGLGVLSLGWAGIERL